jgi:hypothetical protein
MRSSVKKRDTKVLNLENDIANLEKWFDGRKFVLERVYRGSEDGFTAAGFRPKVHMKDNILIVAESDSGKKFGGYTSLVLLDGFAANGYYSDKQAFIFSLTHQTKHKLNQGKEANSIYYGPGYLILFGDGHDIYLNNNCNTGNNTANLGAAYEAPPGIAYNTDPSKSYLGGAVNFKIKEIEAFQVKFY